MAPRTASLYSVIVVLIISVSLTLASLLISLHAASEAHHEFCTNLRLTDDTYHQEPPATATGKKLAAGIAALRAQRCPN